MSARGDGLDKAQKLMLDLLSTLAHPFDLV
jgi:hypothetical protein